MTEEKRDTITLGTINSSLLLLALLGLAFHYLSPILQPLFIAIFLYYLISPMASTLNKFRVPILASYLSILLCLLVICLGLGVVLYHNIGLFEAQVPGYHKKIQSWLEHLDKTELREVDWRQISRELFGVHSVSRWINWLFGTIMEFVSSFMVVLFYLIFIILGAHKLSWRIQTSLDNELAARILEVSKNINSGIQKYLLIKTGISLGTGASSGLIMYLFGLDFWLLWAVLIFFANYIPYIGSAVACVFPIFLGFIQFSNPYMAIFLALLLVATQIFWGNFLEPYWAGKHLSISPLVLLILLAYWGWLWGIVGMLLAFPLAIVIRTILYNFEKTKPIALIISED